MTITNVIDISSSLDFTAPGKNVVFTSYVNHLFQDLIALAAQGEQDNAHAIGKLLASYLEGKERLVSRFNWQVQQDYYDRFILYGSQEHNITVMALIWPKNTFSPIHYHQTWCVFGVYAGALKETLYIPEGNKLAETSTRSYSEGAWAYDSSKEKYYHKLGNAEEKSVISLHIYGVSPDNLSKINCTVSP